MNSDEVSGLKNLTQSLVNCQWIKIDLYWSVNQDTKHFMHVTTTAFTSFLYKHSGEGT